MNDSATPQGGNLFSTGGMQTLLPEVFYRNPLPSAVNAIVSGAPYVEVNDAWLEFFGLERDAVLGQRFDEVRLWIDDASYAALRRDLAAHASMRDREAHVRRADGATAEVLLTWQAFEHADQRVTLWVFNDISARKATERALVDSERRFEAVFEFSVMGMTLVSLDSSVFLNVNRAFESMMGYPREEMVGRTVAALNFWADPVDRVRMLDILSRQRTATIEAKVRRKDGSLFDVQFSVTPIELQGERVLHGMMQDVSGLRRATALKAQSEERFARIVEASPQAMTITRLADGVYLDINRAAEDLLGRRREEVIGRSSIELGIWADPGARDRIRAQFAAGQRVAVQETQVRAKDGRLIDIHFSGTVIELDGEPVLHGTVFDLTAIKQAEHQRRASELQLVQVFDVSPNPTMIARTDDTHIRVNRAWHEFMGYTPEELQRNPSLLTAGWVDPGFRARRLAMLKSGVPVRGIPAQRRTKSGELRDLLLSSSLLAQEDGDYLVSSMTDVTELRASEKRLAASEERLSKVFRSSPVALVITRVADGYYLDMNDAWPAMFGYTREAVIGRTAGDIGIWLDMAERDRMVAELRRAGQVRDFETRFRCRSGAIADVVLSAEPITFDDTECMVINQ